MHSFRDLAELQDVLGKQQASCQRLDLCPLALALMALLGCPGLAVAYWPSAVGEEDSASLTHTGSFPWLPTRLWPLLSHHGST